MRTTALIVTGILWSGAHSAPVVDAVQPEATGLAEPAFTEQQASRGQDVYARACTGCHRDDLSGNEDGAPALSGPAFLKRWAGRPVSEFYFVLAETMPQDAPGELTRQEYVDIISFILKRNGVTAAAIELPQDEQSLTRIGMTPTRAPG